MPGPYYVGPGGNDANAGTSWAARKLTLNGAENIPVVAGDTVYVGPGVYREMLTCDVAGAAGSPISYIGDVTGRRTDGVGGVVRVTGSNDDIAFTRAHCVECAAAGGKHYRLFQGFSFDRSQFAELEAQFGDPTNWIIRDCTFTAMAGQAAGHGVYIVSAAASGHLIERCVFGSAYNGGIYLGGSHINSGDVIRNCLFVGLTLSAIGSASHGGVSITNCTFVACGDGVRVSLALPVNFIAVIVENSLFWSCQYGLRSTTLTHLVENYNALFGNSTNRTNVAVGAQSNAYPALLAPPLQSPGYAMPWHLGDLSQWSLLRQITGSANAAVDDLYGRTRPVTAAKKSWGAVQWQPVSRDAVTVHTVGGASVKLADAGRHAIWVPTSGILPMTFSVYVYREANYAGTNPSLVVKQPGQADQVVVDAGAAGGWNPLTLNVTPVALPGYLVVELVSENTAVAGNYAAYFDDLVIT
jgi:hypothetical protein